MEARGRCPVSSWTTLPYFLRQSSHCTWSSLTRPAWRAGSASLARVCRWMPQRNACFYKGIREQIQVLVLCGKLFSKWTAFQVWVPRVTLLICMYVWYVSVWYVRLHVVITHVQGMWRHGWCHVTLHFKAIFSLNSKFGSSACLACQIAPEMPCPPQSLEFRASHGSARFLMCSDGNGRSSLLCGTRPLNYLPRPSIHVYVCVAVKVCECRFSEFRGHQTL